MHLTDVRLQNFRSYKDSSFELSKGVNIVVGPNTAGKTNLVEALLLISNGNTYRDRKNLITNRSDWARIDVHSSDNEQRTLKLVKQDDLTEKTFEINNKILKRLTFNYKNPVVLFEPNNLFLFQAEPAARREYFDENITGLYDNYSTATNSYKRTLAQRNALLKNPKKDPSQLFVWTLRLCEWAEKIIQYRIEFIEKINRDISETYSKIANKKTTVKIDYLSKTNTIGNYSANLMKDLELATKIDEIKGFTSFGPHRDDYLIKLNDKEAVQAASRGEVRTIVLSLKIIQLKLLESVTGKKPLFLLDDVFSELDGSRRKALTEHLQSHQSVITTTDADIVLKNFSQKSNIIAL